RGVENPLVLDMERRPTIEELIDKVADGSNVPLDDIKKRRGGHVYPVAEQYVLPAREGRSGRLVMMAPDVEGELAELYGHLTTPEPEDSYRFRLIGRRDRDVYNSVLTDFEALRARKPYSAAYMNPADIYALGLEPGAPVTISSRYATISAVLAADSGLR